MHWLGLLQLFLLAYVLLVVLLTAGLYRAMRRPTRFTYADALARGCAAEPAELGLDAQTLTLRDAAGNTSPAWRIAGRDPDGPIVLMLHGFARSRYSELELAPLFLDHAATLILPDLPAHGESSARVSTAGVTEYRDVIAFAEQVRDGARPIVLYGRSMGAGVALAAAAHEPNMFAGVLGEGIYRTWHGPIRNRLRLRRWPTEPMVSLAGLAFRVWFHGLGDYDRAGLAARLQCPLLLMHGTEDAVCHLEDAERIAAAAPDAELIPFPGAMHLNLHTHDPPRYRDAIATFYARLTPQPTLGASE